MQTGSRFFFGTSLCNYSIETIFVANTTELFLWNNKTAGINSSIFGQGHGYALLEVLPLYTAIHKRKD